MPLFPMQTRAPAVARHNPWPAELAVSPLEEGAP